MLDNLILEDLTKKDKELLKTALKKYHSAKNNITKINALNDICDNMIDNSWEKYQFYQYDLIQKAIASNPSTQELKSLKTSLAGALNNIGYIHYNRGNILQSLEYYHQSLKIREEIGDKKGMANSYNNIGSIHYDQDDIPQALKYFHQSLKIRKEIGDKKGMAISYSNIGSSKLKTGDLATAETHLTKGLELAREIGSPEWTSFSSGNLSRLFKQTGRYQKALEMYELEIKMLDSLNNKTTQKATAQQQAKYEYEKQKALDDAEHEKQLAIEQKVKEKQQILIYTTAGGLALVGIFLLFVFNRLKVTRKQKGMIEEAHHELEEKNQEILDSINYAKRIQSAILPPAKLVEKYLKKNFILYKPKDVVAGDFYWIEHKDGKVLFAAADCTGHGVPGAMVSVVCNNALNKSVREYGLTDPGKILTKTRETIIQEFEKSEEEVKDGMDIALCSLEGNKLQYAGANNPLWIIRKGEIIETKANKQPIGQFDNPMPYTTHSFELQKEDTLYIFSDGYVDQFGGEQSKKFKTKAFRELLLSIQNKSMEEQRQIIDEAFESWRGDLEQIDDVCVIGVKV